MLILSNFLLLLSLRVYAFCLIKFMIFSCSKKEIWIFFFFISMSFILNTFWWFIDLLNTEINVSTIRIILWFQTNLICIIALFITWQNIKLLKNKFHLNLTYIQSFHSKNLSNLYYCSYLNKSFFIFFKTFSSFHFIVIIIINIIKIIII